LESDLFRILHLLNTGCPDANVADIFQMLITISCKGQPSVAAKARSILRRRFDTDVRSIRSF
jgi:hypothetical protein